MRILPAFIFAVTISIVMHASAWSQIRPDTQETLISGQYDEAVQIGVGQDSSDGYTLAAAAIVAKIMTHGSDDIKDDAKQARKFAEKAIQLNSENAEAYLQYAVADGMVARSTGNLKAFLKKLPQKTKAAIETARAIRPQDARGDALSGSWHLNVVRKAGAGSAKSIFGATAEEGIAAYEQAQAKSSNDIIITANYAMSLLALDAQTYGVAGQDLLQSVETMPAQSHIERVFQQWSTNLLANFDNPETVQSMASFFLDGE